MFVRANVVALCLPCRTGQSGGGLSLNGSVALEASRFESNIARDNGGAILVHGGGTVKLLSSTFEENSAPSGGLVGLGIANLGGDVLCDQFDCIEVCTYCEPVVSPLSNDDGASSPPVSQPSSKPPDHKDVQVIVTQYIAGATVIIASFCTIVCIGMRSWRRRRGGQRQSGDEDLQCGYEMIIRDATDTGDEQSQRSQPFQLDSRSDWSLLENAPAPILIVDHDLRIKAWSSGEFVCRDLSGRSLKSFAS